MPYERTLQAGPLRALFRDGTLSHVRLGAFEVIERIYGAVRDRNWGTPPGRIENLSEEETAGGFRVCFDSVHQEHELDFRWRGTITGSADGRLSFAMDGKAHSTFLRNRIGLCVHHPLRECAGKFCRIETADGAFEDSQFPQFVAPHQPFRSIRAMTYDVAGIRAELRFSGDIFETEDHRNWTDANFKTYGTPLSLPFPVEIAARSEVHQRVDLTLEGGAANVGSAPGGGLVHVHASGSPASLPRIGLALPRNGRPASRAEHSALQRLRLAHLRVDYSLGDGSLAVVERAAEEAEAIGAKLEIAVTLPGDPGRAAAWSPVADRWLVYSESEAATGSSAALAFRQALGREAVVVAGTNANFAELNRNRPDGDGWDAACFSVNPQMHVFDDESVMANAAAQYDVVRSAQRFLFGRAVVVSPVTLRQRFLAGATGSAPSPEADPRQKLPFCAAWTVASLKALAEAGASSVTYYETRGAGGVLEGDELYPVYRVFEAIGVSGGAFLRCEVSEPSRVAALAFDLSGQRRYLIANLTPTSCEIEIAGAGGHVLAPYDVVSIREPES